MSTETGDPIVSELIIDAEERAELVTLLERELGETRVEVHHTHTPEFRERVIQQETVLRRLLKKLNGSRP